MEGASSGHPVASEAGHHAMARRHVLASGARPFWSLGEHRWMWLVLIVHSPFIKKKSSWVWKPKCITMLVSLWTGIECNHPVFRAQCTLTATQTAASCAYPPPPQMACVSALAKTRWPNLGSNPIAGAKPGCLAACHVFWFRATCPKSCRKNRVQKLCRSRG